MARHLPSSRVRAALKMTQWVWSCGSFSRLVPCWNIATGISAGRTWICPSLSRIRVYEQWRSTVSSRATRAASLWACSISPRSSGSATAQSADTLLSAEKVMSRPAERFSLPAFLVSFWGPSGAKP